MVDPYLNSLSENYFEVHKERLKKHTGYQHIKASRIIWNLKAVYIFDLQKVKGFIFNYLLIADLKKSVNSLFQRIKNLG